jgi:hypothetical protein
VETWTMVELGTHLAYRKSECWKLSTYSCARRRSIPTYQKAQGKEAMLWGITSGKQPGRVRIGFNMS